jgi:aminoglycoside phosphotransferase (APT) family kinase protein
MVVKDPSPAAAAAAGEVLVMQPEPLLHAEVADYALARELVAPAQIVAGDLVIRNLSSRNRVYALESRNGPSWLLKQGVGQSGTAMVANEAHAYAALQELGPEISRHLPPWRGYDQQRSVLTLGLLDDALSLRALDQRSQRPPVRQARELGRALGLVHRMTMQDDAGAGAGWMPAGLLLHRPGVELLHEGSMAAIELVKIIQQAPGFAENLEELRGQWQARAFTHLDVKWDNCLAWGAHRGRVALIDWESACVGDPCWDIGSALSHYLSAWIFSVPVTGQTPPEHFAELAARPLAESQPAIGACWDAYAAELRLQPATERGWLLQSVRFAAARLVLTAFETAQVSPQLTGPLVLHLQLALNMLERPQEAAVHLLGIPLERGRPG